MVSRRTLAIVAIAVGALAAIAALTVLRSPTNVITLTVLGEDTGTMQAIEKVKGRFEEAHGVQVATVKNTFEVLQQRATADLSAGTGLYDLILNYNFSLSSYVRNGWVLPVAELNDVVPGFSDPKLENDLFPNVWREVGFYRLKPGSEPVAIGYPFAANTMLLVYNKRMFADEQNRTAFRQRFGRDLEPPKTWSDLRDAASALSKPSDGQYGIVLHGASGGWLYYEWLNFVFGMGGGVMKKNFGWEGDPSTPLLLSSAQTIAATDFYLGLREFSAGDYLSTGQNEQVELMRKGNVAMAIVWSDTLFSLTRGTDGNQFGFLPIPGDKSQIGGGIFYLNRRSKQAGLAADFVKFLLSPAVQRELLALGLCSPLRSAYADGGAESVPYGTALRAALEKGAYMAEAGPDADAVQEIVTATVQRIARGQTTAAVGLAEAQVELSKRRQAIFESSR